MKPRLLFQLRERLFFRRALLQHRCVSGDCEEVLRQAVVDLACDARPLVGNRPAELRIADRTPDADEQKPVGEHP